MKDKQGKYHTFSITNSKSARFNMYGVIYDKTVQENLIKKRLKIYYDEFCKPYIKKMNENCGDKEVYKEYTNREVILDMTKALSGYLSLFIQFFKQNEFYPEEEFRITIDINDLDDCNEFIFYRKTEKYFIPYIEIAFYNGDEEKLIPVKSITIGPTNGEDVVKEGIKGFLTSTNYNNEIIKLSKSNIPLRF